MLARRNPILGAAQRCCSESSKASLKLDNLASKKILIDVITVLSNDYRKSSLSRLDSPLMYQKQVGKRYALRDVKLILMNSEIAQFFQGVRL